MRLVRTKTSKVTIAEFVGVGVGDSLPLGTAFALAKASLKENRSQFTPLLSRKFDRQL